MRFFILFIFLVNHFCSAQNSYNFDHRLEYEYVKNKNTLPEKRIVFTNSKAANYYLLVTPANQSYEVFFLDYNGFTSSFKLEREEFLENIKFNLDCSDVFKVNNPFKYMIRSLHIISQKDTLLGEEKHKMFMFKNIKARKEKRRKSIRTYYVIEKDTEYHKPFFLYHLAYEENKKENSMPGGIHKIMYSINYQKDTTEIYRLKNISRINKIISIEEGCKNLK